MEVNHVVIDAEFFEIDSLRFTPAGVAIIEFKLRHESQRVENGISRKVECEIDAIALADLAQWIAKINVGQQAKVLGFLAKKSHKSSRLILHVNEIDIGRKN